jgi:uncharacterized protein
MIYPGLGELSRFDAVKMSRIALSREKYEAGEPIMIHLTVTGRCYARCKGCINSSITAGSAEPRNRLLAFQETEPKRDAALIGELASRFGRQPITVCFYGGEPFLAADKMERVWKILKELKEQNEFRFMAYTNGEFLIEALELYPEFMKCIWLYSISIDGDEEQHNRVRLGTRLSKIKINLKRLSESYKGHVLLWSTLREEQSLFNCFEEFLRLCEAGLVNHFFWHWVEERHPFENFSSYLRSYGQELERIMEIYVQEISKGRLLPIAHINELVLYLLTGRVRGHTACGVELAKNYDIVSGKVYSCADLPASLSIGELDEKGKLNLRECDLNLLVAYKEGLGCYKCGVHAYCGGRCPVQVVAGSRERALQYCQLMRLHVGIVQKRVPEIFKGLEENRITLQEVYDRSAFLARYTDVVP